MRTLFALAIACLCAGTAFAQDPAPVRPIQVGPHLSLNVTTNTVDYKVSGPERDWGMGSRIGVIGDIPVGDNMAVVAGLDYYTLSFSDKNKAVDVTPTGSSTDKDEVFPDGTFLTTEGSFNYLALTTMFRVSNFTVGFTFGLPLTATITNSFDPQYPMPIRRNNGSNDDVYILQKDISPPSSERSFLIEARIGGDFPLYANESGSLHLLVSAAYPLTQMISSAAGEDIVTDLGNGQKKVTTVTYLPHLNDNFRLPTLSLGVSYLFNL